MRRHWRLILLLLVAVVATTLPFLLHVPIHGTRAGAAGAAGIILVLILAGLAITLLLFTALIFATGKLFPVLALDRWKQSRIAVFFRWIRRHWVIVLYAVVAILFLAPNPFHNFQTNRHAYRQMLDLFLGFDPPDEGYSSQEPDTWTTWVALFLAPLLGGLARLLPMRRRFPAFLLNVLVPAVAVAFCLEELFLFFGGFLLEYFTVPSNFASGPLLFIVVCSTVAALAFTGIAGAAFRRLSPARSMRYAGLAITLIAIPELLLFSAAYYAGHLSYGAYGFGDAFERLPVYLWIGIGFLICSDLFSAPEKQHRRPSTGKAADSAQTFALTAIALCAFGVTQVPHSVDTFNRLKALREAFAMDTFVDRIRSKPGSLPGAHLTENDYFRTLAAAVGESHAVGMDAQIDITMQTRGSGSLLNVSVTEQNGPHQTSSWTAGLSPTEQNFDAQPGDALQKLLGSTDKDIHKEDVFERLYHEDEVKITSETTSIPGTPVQISSQYISWCLVLLNIVILCLIEDRLKLAEAKPEDACDAYLLWGNTFITRTIAVVWPFWLAFAMLLQVAGVAAITLYQGVALGWLLLPLLILAACVAPVAFSIAMSCYRIRRAIRNSLAAPAPPPDAAAPATP